MSKADKSGGDAGKPAKPGSRPRNGVVFRRFITLRNGRVLDAFEYGHKAWPIGSRR